MLFLYATENLWLLLLQKKLCHIGGETGNN